MRNTRFQVVDLNVSLPGPPYLIRATFWIEAGQKESLELDFLQIYRLLYGLNEANEEEIAKIDDAFLGV